MWKPESWGMKIIDVEEHLEHPSNVASMTIDSQSALLLEFVIYVVILYIERLSVLSSKRYNQTGCRNKMDKSLQGKARVYISCWTGSSSNNKKTMCVISYRPSEFLELFLPWKVWYIFTCDEILIWNRWHDLGALDEIKHAVRAWWSNDLNVNT